MPTPSEAAFLVMTLKDRGQGRIPNQRLVSKIVFPSIQCCTLVHNQPVHIALHTLEELKDYTIALFMK